jgi:hypothetical protein
MSLPTTNRMSLSDLNRVARFTNGNLGIGTTSPASRLHLANSSTAANIVFEAGTTADGASGNSGWSAINFNGFFNVTEQRINTSKNRWRLVCEQRTTEDKMFLETFNGSANTNLLTFTTAGNIGIGTYTPSYKLHIVDSSSSPFPLWIDGTGKTTNTGINVNSASGYISFINLQVNGAGPNIAGYANRLDITQSASQNTCINPNGGSVGIGTISPSHAFHVSASNLGDTIRIENTSSSSYASIQLKTPSQNFIVGVGGASEASLAYRDKLYMVHSTGTFGLTMTTNGNIGIGTSAPSSSYKLTVGGSIYADVTNRIETINLSAQSNTTFYPVVIDNPSDASEGTHYIDIEMPSQGGSAAYNMHSMQGTCRGGGWSDQVEKFDVHHNYFTDGERSILGVWRGTRDFYGVVVYLRGGMTYRLITRSKSVTTYTSAATVVTVNGGQASTFALKNVSGADVSGTSSNIIEMVNFINNPSGRIMSERLSVATAIGVATAQPYAALHIAGQAYITNSLVGTPQQSTLGGDGTKIVLWPGGASSIPYGLGVENAHTWFSADFGFKWYNTPSGAIMQLTAGNLLTTGDVIAFSSISDARLKKDVEAISDESSFDIVNSLRPVSFTWLDTISNENNRGKRDIGFIAQEVEASSHYAVSEFNDINTQETYKRIKYERLVPYLVGSIKHLTAKLDEYKAELDDLRSRLN